MSILNTERDKVEGAGQSGGIRWVQLPNMEEDMRAMMQDWPCPGRAGHESRVDRRKAGSEETKEDTKFFSGQKELGIE